MEEQETYSVALRLRRVTVEDTYVSVIVNEAILVESTDGSARLDFAKFVAAAIQLGNSPLVEWQVESSVLEPHPTQGPKPDDRRILDTTDVM